MGILRQTNGLILMIIMLDEKLSVYTANDRSENSGRLFLMTKKDENIR